MKVLDRFTCFSALKSILLQNVCLRFCMSACVVNIFRRSISKTIAQNLIKLYNQLVFDIYCGTSGVDSMQHFLRFSQ